LQSVGCADRWLCRHVAAPARPPRGMTTRHQPAAAPPHSSARRRTGRSRTSAHALTAHDTAPRPATPQPASTTHQPRATVEPAPRTRALTHRPCTTQPPCPSRHNPTAPRSGLARRSSRCLVHACSRADQL